MKTTWIIAVWVCVGLSVMADTIANGITTVAPTSATQGDSVIVVTMTLDSTAVPPPPPIGTVPDNMRIGTIEGYNISRSGYDCTATFDIPVGEAVGLKTAEVYFPDDAAPPPELSFQKANGFEVLPAGDQPVIDITTASTVVSNDVVSFTINGTNNAEVVGSMVWTNQSTGASGLLPVSGTIFQLLDVALNEGGNIILVSGTNDAGVAASDSVAISRYPAGSISKSYVVVDTAQIAFFNNSTEITAPVPGAVFYGQDAHYESAQPNYMDIGNGMVLDVNTGLTWQQSPDLNDDGVIDINDKLTQQEMQAQADALNATNYGGYSDWRVPSIKELYSLMDFRGTDPMSDDTSSLIPFIDTDYFDFAWGDTANGERTIDSQYGSSTLYVHTTMNGDRTLFGVNFADGRIKGYPANDIEPYKEFLLICCRGNTDYGINDFADNGDGTVTDHATGLMWQQADSGAGLLWDAALDYAEALELGGYRDWRLPNAKELQSIIDYSRSPDTTDSAAIDTIFFCSTITNEEGEIDFPWYFNSSTHVQQGGGGDNASYFCFGRALGYMNSSWMDVHGAGAQRSDPKIFDTTGYTYVTDGYYFTVAPQGDAARWYNYARCVRGGATEPQADTDGDGLTDAYEYNYAGSATGMDATADTDGDGVSNGDENVAGTIPTLGTSLLQIIDFGSATNGMIVHWSSELDRSYRMTCSTNLVDDAFSSLVASNLPATPPENEYTAEPSSANCFYRIEVE